MQGPFTLVVNPAAGRGRALRLLPQITAAVQAAGASCEVSQSRSLADARRIAAEAASAGHAVIAVGGDGMVGAVAAATAAAGGTLGIVPAGRGNDFARVLGIGTDPGAAAAILTGQAPRQVDLVGVSVPGQDEVVVAGSVYTGVPSVAGEIANAATLLRGPMVYPVAALRAVARWRPVGFTVQAAEDTHQFAGYAVVAANGSYFGAGMLVAPPARVDDRELDLVLMRDGPKLAFVRALTKIKDGSHVHLAEVSLHRCADMTLTMDRDMPVAADGETLPWAAPLPAGTPLRVRVLPGALSVIAPPASG